MFKKSSGSGHLNIFTSPKSLFSGNSLKMYEDEQAWHNQFRKQVTMRIDEDIFRPLYCLDNGTPNAPIRLLYTTLLPSNLSSSSNRSSVKTEKGYRYFVQKDIDGYLIRKKIAETPIETLQFRNNVEATTRAGAGVKSSTKCGPTSAVCG